MKVCQHTHVSSSVRSQPRAPLPLSLGMLTDEMLKGSRDENVYSQNKHQKSTVPNAWGPKPQQATESSEIGGKGDKEGRPKPYPKGGGGDSGPNFSGL